MIHRLQRGVVPPKPHTVFRPEGELAFEHCITRKGFDHAYTIVYHRHPPHWVGAHADLGPFPGEGELRWDGALRRRHFVTPKLKAGGTPFLSRTLLLGNSDIGVAVAHPDRDDETLVQNADSDELIFVQRGAGQVDTVLGVLPFKAEDYVFIPRGFSYRMRLKEPASLLVLECRSWLDLPEQVRNPAGQLKMDAPYTHRDFGAPEWPDGGPATLEAPRKLLVKRHGRLTSFEMTHNIFDAYGWDGALWPFTFPIRAYQPKTGLVHLPPTIHTTFVGGGFVVCSFVPRVTDTHEQAIPCPYPHSSPECDEILFYVAGNFTSRRGISEGSISLHPAGVIHGPHPGTYEASIGTKRTDELAVMVDTFKPLLPTDAARGVEDEPYNLSWHD